MDTRKYFYPKDLCWIQILFGIFLTSQRNCAPKRGNYLQRGAIQFFLRKYMKYFDLCATATENMAHEVLTWHGVNPFGETDCVLTVCGWLKKGVHFVGSPAEWSSVGEAETGSGGDQPVKE